MLFPVTPKRVQRMTTEMVEGLAGVTYEEWLRMRFVQLRQGMNSLLSTISS